MGLYVTYIWMIEVSLVNVTTRSSPRNKACNNRGERSLTCATSTLTFKMFFSRWRSFLHLPLSGRGLRWSTQPRLQVSFPGEPNKPTSLMLPTCSSYTKVLISNDRKKKIQRISWDKIFTSSCYQYPCWGAAPSVVMRPDSAWQKCSVRWWLCVWLHGCNCVCLMNPLSVDCIYVQQKSEMRLVSSVTTSCWTNRRKKRKLGMTQTYADCDCCLCVCTVLGPASIPVCFQVWGCKLGSGKIQQQIGKCFILCSSLATRPLYHVLETIFP